MSRFMTGVPRPKAAAPTKGASVPGGMQRAGTVGLSLAPASTAPPRSFMLQPGNPFSSLGFGALTVFMYLAFGRLTDFYLTFLHLPFIFSSLALVTVILSRRLGVVFTSKIGVVLTLFSAWLVVTIPFSTWRGGSVALLTDQWSKSFAVFVITAVLISTLPHVVKSIHVLAYSFLTTSFLGFVHGQVQQQGRFGLSDGMYQGANELATAMVQGCIYWLFLVGNPNSPGWKRLIALFSFPPILWILLKTGSRAGMLVLLVVLVMVFLRSSHQGKMVIVVLSAACVLLGTALAPASVKTRLFILFQVDAMEVAGELGNADVNSVTAALGSSTQRLALLKTAILLTFQNPLFGVGPGQFSVQEDQEARDAGRARGAWLGTHNTYAQISSETGFPGLILFVACLVFCWQTLRATEKKLKKRSGKENEQWIHAGFILRLSLISYIVFFFFEHIGYDMFLPMLAGQILAYSRAVDNYMRESEKPESAPAMPVPGWRPAIS